MLPVLLAGTCVAEAADPDRTKPPEKVPQKPPLGSKERPVRCDDPDGEHDYLGRLRDAEGKQVAAYRLGSTGPNEAGGNILDHYTLEFGEVARSLYMDMYHFRYHEREPPPGLRIVHEYCENYEYVDGLIHKWGEDSPFSGEMTQDYSDGGRYAVAQVQEGKIQGELKRLWAGGQVMETIPYERGLRAGLGKYYYESGKLWARYTYRNGQVEGPVTVYHENGNVRYRGTVMAGRFAGLYESFYESGAQKIRGIKNRGRWDGEFIHWAEDGTVLQQLEPKRNAAKTSAN